jgi:2-polyprenyl-3-methyl-5-hydroxy-6-metoxy-1,4-benzoquinol methylase
MSFFQACKICGSPITDINKRYQLVQCNSCEFIFCQEIFTDAVILKTYDDLYNNTSSYQQHQNEYNLLKIEKQIRLGWSKRSIIKGLLQRNIKDICEVGAGVGLVGQYTKRMNNLSYSGIELDVKTAQKARSLDLNVIQGSFTELEKYQNSFDAIIGFEVLEHLQDLKLFFTLGSKALKSGGYLGFSVPNYNKIKNYQPGSDKLYQDTPPVHLNFFTIKNITNILAASGFSIVTLKVKSLPYMNLRVKETYRLLFRALIGTFEGPTIICLAKKV